MRRPQITSNRRRRSRAMIPDVTAFFDEATNTVSYVVKDPDSRACAIIDSGTGGNE